LYIQRGAIVDAEFSTSVIVAGQIGNRERITGGCANESAGVRERGMNRATSADLASPIVRKWASASESATC
jgi:hypothetical protein